MAQGQNKPFPSAGFLLSWLSGAGDNEMTKNYLKTLSADEIDKVIEGVKKDAPFEDKLNGDIIKFWEEIKQKKDLL